MRVFRADGDARGRDAGRASAVDDGAVGKRRGRAGLAGDQGYGGRVAAHVLRVAEGSRGEAGAQAAAAHREGVEGGHCRGDPGDGDRIGLHRGAILGGDGYGDCRRRIRRAEGHGRDGRHGRTIDFVGEAGMGLMGGRAQRDARDRSARRNGIALGRGGEARAECLAAGLREGGEVGVRRGFAGDRDSIGLSRRSVLSGHGDDEIDRRQVAYGDGARVHDRAANLIVNRRGGARRAGDDGGGGSIRDFHRIRGGFRVEGGAQGSARDGEGAQGRDIGLEASDFDRVIFRGLAILGRDGDRDGLLDPDLKGDRGGIDGRAGGAVFDRGQGVGGGGNHGDRGDVIGYGEGISRHRRVEGGADALPGDREGREGRDVRQEPRDRELVGPSGQAIAGGDGDDHSLGDVDVQLQGCRVDGRALDLVGYCRVFIIRGRRDFYARRTIGDVDNVIGRRGVEARAEGLALYSQ